MCDGFDLEPWSLYRTRAHVARKSHKCSCCGGSIVIGDRYRVLVTVLDGEFSSEKECPECIVMIDRFEYEHGTRSNSCIMPRLVLECIEYSDDHETAERWKADIDRIRSVK